MIGDQEHLEYAVIGDTVNRTSKLQNHTWVERGAALASLNACYRALAQGYIEHSARKIFRSRKVNGIPATADLTVIAGS